MEPYLSFTEIKALKAETGELMLEKEILNSGQYNIKRRIGKEYTQLEIDSRLSAVEARLKEIAECWKRIPVSYDNINTLYRHGQ